MEMDRKRIGSKYACFFIALALIVLSGCAHIRYERGNYIAHTETLEEVLRYYDYPSFSGKVSVSLIDISSRYAIKKVEMGEKILIDYYELKEGGKHPLIIISPILGGDNALAKLFAEYFASHGFSCAIIHRSKWLVNAIKKTEGLEGFEEIFKEIVIYNRQAIDWLVQQEKVDRDNLGTFGISMGGIINSILAGIDKRLKCHVITLAGGSIADILYSSNEPGIVAWRDRLRDKNNMTEEEFHETLEKIIKTDPIRVANFIDPEHVLMFIAVFDRTVPKKYGRRLWKEMGKPEVIYLPFGHYSSSIAIPYVKRVSLLFFKRCLG